MTVKEQNKALSQTSDTGITVYKILNLYACLGGNRYGL